MKAPELAEFQDRFEAHYKDQTSFGVKEALFAFAVVVEEMGNQVTAGMLAGFMLGKGYKITPFIISCLDNALAKTYADLEKALEEFDNLLEFKIGDIVYRKGEPMQVAGFKDNVYLQLVYPGSIMLYKPKEVTRQ